MEALAALTTFVPWVGGGPDAMRMCHVDVNRGGLAENGRRGYTGPVRKFNYGDSIPLEAGASGKNSRSS